MSESLPEHVEVNRAYWDERAHQWVRAGEEGWAQSAPTWGAYEVPESELSLLPDDMSGMEAIELGCGTAYCSAWMARRGKRRTGNQRRNDPGRFQKSLEERPAGGGHRRLSSCFGVNVTVPFFADCPPMTAHRRFES
jgi:hypothetical protein